MNLGGGKILTLNEIEENDTESQNLSDESNFVETNEKAKDS